MPYTYQDIDGTYNDYVEIIIQIGYVIMFSTCFEAAPLIALASNYFKLKLDRIKMLNLT